MTDVDDPDRARRERGMRAVSEALAKFNAGESHDEVCPFCGGALVVEGATPRPCTAWYVRCPCGRSNSVFKGL